eukprot:Tbor_TRINITY_DN5283_c1_g2::TRINITY_DN5283_c1_g2_i3::g.16798::m.16798/K02871/RP-L13, MRPL13, rplM; large subunit ribosomal protein L13
MIAGDHVIVKNCKDVVMVGDDWVRIPINWNTPWPGGKYRIRLSDMYERDPCMLVWYYCSKALLDSHGRKLKSRKAPIEKLWLYEDNIHPHAQMNPRPLEWYDKNPRRKVWRSDDVKTRWRVNSIMQ